MKLFLVSFQWKRTGNIDSYLVAAHDAKSAQRHVRRYMDRGSILKFTGAKEINARKPGIIHGINRFV